MPSQEVTTAFRRLGSAGSSVQASLLCAMLRVPRTQWLGFSPRLLLWNSGRADRLTRYMAPKLWNRIRESAMWKRAAFSVSSLPETG